uniref:Uncharacterized protein n=1 Tax=Parastrongyloides trichosuri TaxID=131310 RepID=A0A0N4Z3U1_PARTI
MSYFFYILLVLSIFEISNCQNRITVPQSIYQRGGALNVRTTAPSTTTKKPSRASSDHITDNDLNEILNDLENDRKAQERRDRFNRPTFSPYLNYDNRQASDFDLSDALDTNEVEKTPSRNGGYSGFGTHGNGHASSRFYNALGSAPRVSNEATRNFMNCQCTCEVPSRPSYGEGNQYGPRGSRGCNQRYY